MMSKPVKARWNLLNLRALSTKSVGLGDYYITLIKIYQQFGGKHFLHIFALLKNTRHVWNRRYCWTAI